MGSGQQRVGVERPRKRLRPKDYGLRVIEALIRAVWRDCRALGWLDEAGRLRPEWPLFATDGRTGKLVLYPEDFVAEIVGADGHVARVVRIRPPIAGHFTPRDRAIMARLQPSAMRQGPP
jgi:hypothetical protein